MHESKPEIAPGRQLDILVAEKVMRLEPWPGFPGAFRAPIILPGQTPKPCAPPEYSTDIAAAWEVVEKLREQGAAFCIEQHPMAEEPTVWFLTDKNMSEGIIPTDHQEHISATAATVPLAICLAALKAAGGEI